VWRRLKVLFFRHYLDSMGYRWRRLAAASESHRGARQGMQPSEMKHLAEGLLGVALAAARVQMSYFSSGVAVERKADHSPVTAADRESE
jgi:hypothetical protein